MLEVYSVTFSFHFDRNNAVETECSEFIHWDQGGILIVKMLYKQSARSLLIEVIVPLWS
jgi:hypothetical protein